MTQIGDWFSCAGCGRVVDAHSHAERIEYSRHECEQDPCQDAYDRESEAMMSHHIDPYDQDDWLRIIGAQADLAGWAEDEKMIASAQVQMMALFTGLLAAGHSIEDAYNLTVDTFDRASQEPIE